MFVEKLAHLYKEQKHQRIEKATMLGIYRGMNNMKHPGGWETALAVKHVLNKDSLGAVAPYTFLDQHYLMFFPGKI